MPSPSCVLVTGGSRGIGRAIVETLVRAGHEVAFTWHSDEATAREVVEACDGRPRAFHADARDRTRPASLVGEVEAALGPIAGLVNNAGLRIEALLALTTDDEWDRVLDTNLGFAFRLCRAVLPGMVTRRRGSIVNVSSLSASHGLVGQAAYAASKAGLVAITRVLSREVGRRGVRVNAVLPGLVATDLTKSLTDEVVTALRATESLPAGTTPSSVAAAVAFLLSDAASAITGQTLVVDAGASA